MVSLLVQDPDVLLFGNEAVLRDGDYVGYVRAGATATPWGAVSDWPWSSTWPA